MNLVQKKFSGVGKAPKIFQVRHCGQGTGGNYFNQSFLMSGARRVLKRELLWVRGAAEADTKQDGTRQKKRPQPMTTLKLMPFRGEMPGAEGKEKLRGWRAITRSHAGRRKSGKTMGENAAGNQGQKDHPGMGKSLVRLKNFASKGRKNGEKGG